MPFNACNQQEIHKKEVFETKQLHLDLYIHWVRYDIVVVLRY